ncbi:hypothetical protein DPV78_009893 [Talaromyces pinophilus]|nr:hypothetical protein DPV78_009893 [Talaromyces pinophilus]
MIKCLVLTRNRCSTYNILTKLTVASFPQNDSLESANSPTGGSRACDAAKRGINPFSATNHDEVQQGSEGKAAALACSLCEKANKTCSFTWLRQRTRGQLPETIKMKYLRETPLAYHPRPRQESLRTLDNLQSTSPGSTTSPASRDYHRQTQPLVYEDNLARELSRDTTSDRLFHVYASSFERIISNWATQPNHASPGINILYDRVQRLDGKASALVMRYTSPGHCHRVIKALRLMVMAFASQSNCIKRAVPRNDSGDLQAYEEMFVHVNDFQTLLFQPLWHEARRSLDVRSSLRRSTSLTWELRKDSVYTISDLARPANRLAIEGVSRHIDTRRGHYYEYPLLVDRPFAVIHTAFSETCEILMEWRNHSPEQRRRDEAYLADILKRLGHCINTLDL